jgi:2-(1,2-epoxy-1,2-dihydrophenyl)acetyl-CoA isomerase
MNEFRYLKCSTEKRTKVISINRTAVYNALHFDAKMEIIKALKLANQDQEIRSIIFTGEGNAFCTGQDLNDRTIQEQGSNMDLGHTLETEWNPLIKSFKKSKKIIIGVINGVCAGAGLSIALACDLLVAKPQVKLHSGFSKLGLTLDAGSTFELTRGLGPKKAMEFALLGIWND